MRTVCLRDYPIELIVHDSPELVSDALVDTGTWEPFETRLAMALISPGEVFVDVGANLGYYTAIASRVVGSSGRVIAFEPDPENFRLLTANCGANSNVTLHPLALADHAGRHGFRMCLDNRGDHRLVSENTGLAVEVVRGDDFIEGRVSLLKIDTQGAEVKVLRGLKQTLGRSLPSISLIVEFWPQALEELGSSARELLDELAATELPTWIIDHESAQVVPVTLEQLDELAATIMSPATGGFMNIVATADESVMARFTQ